MIYEILVLILFAMASWRSKSRYAAYCMLAYFITFVFSYSPIYDMLTPSYSYIHIYYAMIIFAFIPIVSSSFYAACGLALYGLFNLIISIDYLFYPPLGIITQTEYMVLHTALVFCLIYLSTKKGDNSGNSTPISHHNINSVESLKCTTQHIQILENGKRWK